MAWPTIENIKNFVESIFYILTLYLASKESGKWRRNLTEKSSFEVARKVLSATYQLRDAIQSCCSGWMSPAELLNEKERDEKKVPYDSTKEAYLAFLKRCERIEEAKANLYPAMVEAEAIFGGKSRKYVEAMLILCNKLYLAIEEYYKAKTNMDETIDRKLMIQWRNIIYGINTRKSPKLPADFTDDDNFAGDLERAVTEIEGFFKKHIGTLNKEKNDKR